MSIESKKQDESDPRQKRGKGLDSWAVAAQQSGLIDPQRYEDFIKQDNLKEEGLEERGLPGLRSYGYFASIEEIRKKLESQKNERFIIRCTSKKTGEKRRSRNITLDEVCSFAEALEGGFAEWNVEVKEFVETKIAGTIIVEPSGRTVIETWRGGHYLNSEDIPRYHAEFDAAKFHHRFHWQAPPGTTDLHDFQESAIRALRYIFPNLKPKPNEPIYIEYGVKPNGEVYFIEANNSPLLTKGWK